METGTERGKLHNLDSSVITQENQLVSPLSSDHDTFDGSSPGPSERSPLLQTQMGQGANVPLEPPPPYDSSGNEVSGPFTSSQPSVKAQGYQQQQQRSQQTPPQNYYAPSQADCCECTQDACTLCLCCVILCECFAHMVK